MVSAPQNEGFSGKQQTVNRPRLNGPRIVGIRPDTPFLHAIAASGVGPMKFTARGLPAGLRCQKNTGIISGQIKKAGTYRVTVGAQNKGGKTLGDLTIICGDQLALTPPLGWNSYDAFLDSVTEAEVLANAAWLKEHLQPYGWDTVVVDGGWYDPQPPGTMYESETPNLTLDPFGRLQPAENRFPSAAGGKGFKPLADQLHAMGLKFGIHMMRGIPRQAVEADLPIFGTDFTASDAVRAPDDPLLECSWDGDMYGVNAATAAGQAWYDAVVRQYAEWGVDYLKADDMASPYVADEIEALRRALDRCGRSIILSLSPGETPLEAAAHVTRHANLWRISADIWDYWGWDGISTQFDLLAQWAPYAGPGHWPDADMIPLGHLSLRDDPHWTLYTPHEQVTLISLWSLAPSPLMLGMNLPDNDAWTTALLTNPEVIAVNQDPLGAPAFRQKGLNLPVEVWVKELQDGSKAVGLFNRTNHEESFSLLWPDLGFPDEVQVRDLWQRKDLGVQSEYAAAIPGHGAALLRVAPLEDVNSPNDRVLRNFPRGQ